jgi:hypothetical protein
MTTLLKATMMRTRMPATKEVPVMRTMTERH